MAGAPPKVDVGVVATVSIEALKAANEAGAASCELDAVLSQAFGADGLGIICVTGGELFQEAVRRIRAELLPLAPALEQLPEAAKARIAERGTRNVSNYTRYVDGHRSGFYFHPALDNPGERLPLGIEPEPTFYTPNIWPDAELPELRLRGREAAPFLVGVGREVAYTVDRCCAAAVAGYMPGTLVSMVGAPENCCHKCRLICYHEYETDEQRAMHKGMWAAPHKDTGLLTALVPGVFFSTQDGARLAACPDPEVGLYVRSHQGAITQISVPPDVGECLFFQVGEALQIVSGGLYHATEHCVRGPPRAGGGYTRASFAVFLQPHAHDLLPFPAGAGPRDVAKRAHDGLFRMYLQYLPEGAPGINFLEFCHRPGF
eukprot:NODE_10568_length_1343_cov_2.432566.p1 GENE.NODE_10568_length_1343_cov_2.432566~~NODE_10568_length_1343_cov_2.432566.p1  ORF type:complete len:390 (-),score=126.87 NODE_10568_length_1343_cov_2.432566:174-1295(-)